jgi:hypothetical protein
MASSCRQERLGRLGESCEWPSGKMLELERAGPARRTRRTVLIVSESVVYWPSKIPGDAPIVSPHSLSLCKDLVARRDTSLSAGRQSWEQGLAGPAVFGSRDR